MPDIATDRSGAARCLLGIQVPAASLRPVMEHDIPALLAETVGIFCFGYPFVLSRYWMTGAILFWCSTERRYAPLTHPPSWAADQPISVIVPCYNEGKNARETFGILAAND
jgi:cellulose synthase/poly-beta-1,6-N-acetylglucosamine synthase-like glycosyltransferase